METIMEIFAVIGIIVSILAVLLFVVWAVSFYSSMAIKTFSYNLGEYCKVKKEHIEKNAQARRLRLAKSREQKNKQKEEMQNIKLQAKQDLFEIKKRENIAKQTAKVEKAKKEAEMRADIDTKDIGSHNYESFITPQKEKKSKKDEPKVEEEKVEEVINQEIAEEVNDAVKVEEIAEAPVENKEEIVEEKENSNKKK